MPIINLSNPYVILVAVVLFVLLVYLAKEMKKSAITCIMLLVFVTMLAGHTIEYIFIENATGEILSTLARCITMDLVFILISFLSYLWIDDIESKEKKINSLDNSLEWFWKKV